MQRDSHGSGVDPRSYVGPYRMDKTLGKGQTGIQHLSSSLLVFIGIHFHADGHILSIRVADPIVYLIISFLFQVHCIFFDSVMNV